MKLKTAILITILFSTFLINSADGKTRWRDEDNRNKDEEHKPVHSKGYGISAWGVVSLIVFGILASVAVYYIIICYPILCKEQRRYDRFELSPV